MPSSSSPAANVRLINTREGQRRLSISIRAGEGANDGAVEITCVKLLNPATGIYRQFFPGTPEGSFIPGPWFDSFDEAAAAGISAGCLKFAVQ